MWVIKYQVIKLIILIMLRMSVVRVLIFGLIFMCMLEKISIGKVVVLGLEIKLVIIRLFSDSVKVSS